MWSERDPQVVVSTIAQENFVPDVKAQSNWTRKSLQPDSRIER
ncbi:MAG: hypothetical protein QOD84_2645, partial [Acidobacteriaceae bacterium]